MELQGFSTEMLEKVMGLESSFVLYGESDTITRLKTHIEKSVNNKTSSSIMSFRYLDEDDKSSPMIVETTGKKKIFIGDTFTRHPALRHYPKIKL